MKREGGALRLAFDHVKAWKTLDGKEIPNFEIAGSDGKFFPARVRAEGAALILAAPEVSGPAAARYMYDCGRLGDLVNEAGLPLGTFEMSVEK
jgi:sialate O-acetylesterase